ncbi:MAG: hypothetical protein HQM16_17345 [Deltaproteobacteria bacterium]|nr:hypothetical protein [Deltaproteobacteria bacterium]
MYLGSALMAVFTVGIVKTAVMILSILLIYRTRRVLGGRPSDKLPLHIDQGDVRPLKILYYSFVLFFFSELCCSIEIYVFLGSSGVIGIMHSIFSAVSMGLFVAGLFCVLDKRLFCIFEPGKKCLGLKLCPRCSFHQDGFCHFGDFYRFILVFFILMSVPVLFASTGTIACDVIRYTLPFEGLNSFYDTVIMPYLVRLAPEYDHSGKAFVVTALQLLFEYRLIPLLALLLFATSFLLFEIKKQQMSVSVCCFAAGMLLFCYFQLMLDYVTGDIILGGLIHELAELWFLIVIVMVLKRVYAKKPDSIVSVGKTPVSPEV